MTPDQIEQYKQTTIETLLGIAIVIVVSGTFYAIWLAATNL